jgi:hypothetical protein
LSVVSLISVSDDGAALAREVSAGVAVALLEAGGVEAVEVGVPQAPSRATSPTPAPAASLRASGLPVGDLRARPCRLARRGMGVTTPQRYARAVVHSATRRTMSTTCGDLLTDDDGGPLRCRYDDDDPHP